MIPRGQIRNSDVEMGMQHSGELGLDMFFKQVTAKYIVGLLAKFVGFSFANFCNTIILAFPS